ncbi:hypothetical protein GCM10012290_03240 [Halolactibacillus alkaliphilus]|uniref:Flagellar hook-length control protein-like C-terminal domain-containing protein n=1 Tax=Halolactibacillus alkaliphilus TaxID=442899 RepID=A0A511WXB9_9BACI|nr:hypothetical protein [Halolactibacillus alkaliphilus]GEN55764.1 hypothetical protein HAL01_02280 [Halolactibacillus alkaliphilus]GGN65055.1 hypothetical protein GCM10012290_03240 [Halolactibacillus alkaliphilus]SFO64423.1 hypothetical protein SAMN05720591_10294 [Halolactibacillus alkaliphilus]
MQVQNLQIKPSFKHAQPNQKMSLTKGQIIKGAIDQLHPDQMATIKMGQQQVTAKLEVPVEKGQSYVFEVVSSGDTPELKMIEQQTVKGEASLSAVLKNMGVPVTKESEQLLSRFLLNNIPVKLSQFKEALVLYQQQPNEKTAQALMTLIKHQLPFSSGIVTAMSQMTLESPQDGFEFLMQQLSSLSASESKTQLLEFLNTMKTTIASPTETVSVEAADKLRALSHALISKGLTVSSESSLPKLLAELLNNQLGLDDKKIIQLKQWLSQTRQPLNQQEREQFLNVNRDALKQWLPKESAVPKTHLITKEAIQVALDKVPDKSISYPIKTEAELVLGMNRLREQLELESSLLNKLNNRLTDVQAETLSKLMSRPSDLSHQQIKDALKPLIDQQLTQAEVKVLTPLIKGSGLIDTLPVEQQFFIGVKDYLLRSGLNYEHQLIETYDVSQNLKQLLLEVQQSTKGNLPALDQLLQGLTDQQMSIVRQDEHFIHYGITLPIVTDNEQAVYLEMYGQKSETGALNPDYCHIAIHLELGAIGETIVDMGVQNRLVQLTVINNQDLKPLIEPFKPSLIKGMASLDYHLTSIHHRPFKDHEDTVTHKQSFKQPQDYKGWDVKA